MLIMLVKLLCEPSPFKCNDTGRRKLDVCMDVKLIEYGISDSRGLGAQPPDAVALLT